MISQCARCEGLGSTSYVGVEATTCWACGGSGFVSDGIAQRPAVHGCGCSACSAARPAPHRPSFTPLGEEDRPLRDTLVGVLLAAVVLVLLILALS